MLKSMKNLNGFTVHATDGDVGHVADCFFDDDGWAVRYLVIDTGGWLSGRQVLLSPFSITALDWAGKRINAGLTRAQVEKSPGIDTALPISRLEESNLNQHYGWPDYWGGVALWGASSGPVLPVPGAAPVPLAPPQPERSSQPVQPADTHLHSMQEVSGYRLQAQDGELGQVVDFLIDEENWAIQAMVVDTKPWWPGGEVAVAPREIEGVAWEQREVVVRQDRAALQQNPEINLDQVRRSG